jgi:hypothetical protein
MQNVFFFKIISNAAVWYFGPYMVETGIESEIVAVTKV